MGLGWFAVLCEPNIETTSKPTCSFVLFFYFAVREGIVVCRNLSTADQGQK